MLYLVGTLLSLLVVHTAWTLLPQCSAWRRFLSALIGGKSFADLVVPSTNIRDLPVESSVASSPDALIKEIHRLRTRHEVTLRLSELITYDGAGSWPPKVAHDVPSSNRKPSPWPEVLRPYSEIYLDLIPDLATADPSLDDEENRQRIHRYRSRMAQALHAKVDVEAVEELLRDVESGKWSLLSPDVINAFHCCLANLRHCYRWATIPVVKVAQRERVISLPTELDRPWPYLQRRFGVLDDTESGNNTANVLHNFLPDGKRMYRINVSLSEEVQYAEDNFFRVFYDVEELGLPIYHCLAAAIMFFDAGELKKCHETMATLTDHIADLMRVFYQTLTNQKIPRRFWLGHVQGFQGWGAGRYVREDGTDVHAKAVTAKIPHELGEKSFTMSEMRGCPMAELFASDSLALLAEAAAAAASDSTSTSLPEEDYAALDKDPSIKFIRYDGLSGNHVLVFQAVDAFLGLPIYLPDENMQRYVPRRQREFSESLRRHNFRQYLANEAAIDVDMARQYALIDAEIEKILKHMRLFRAAHRTRALPYLRQPAPERMAMTAGKSILVGQTIEDALKPLDDLMVERLGVTV